MYFVVAPIVQDPQIEYFYVLAYIMCGFLAYILFVKYRCRTKVLGEFDDGYNYQEVTNSSD